MIRGTVLLVLSFLCFSVGVFGHKLGIVTLQVAVPLVYAAGCMLCALLGVIMLGWVPAHDMIQRIRQSAYYFTIVDRLCFVDDDFNSRTLTGDTPPPRKTR